MVQAVKGLLTHPQPTAAPRHGHRQEHATDFSGVRVAEAFMTLLLVVAVTAALPTSIALAQEASSQIPVLGKLSTQGSAQAFSGKLESLDLKRSLLKVNTVQGGHVEIFQVKKGVSIYTAGGEKLKPSELKPGTDVLVYFEVKSERRTAKEIIVLANVPPAKKKAPPPS